MTSTSRVPVYPELDVQQAISVKREQLHLSRRELGRRCGLSAAYVSALEAGNLRPSLRVFAKLAVELRLTSQEIVLVITTEAHKKENTS